MTSLIEFEVIDHENVDVFLDRKHMPKVKAKILANGGFISWQDQNLVSFEELEQVYLKMKELQNNSSANTMKGFSTVGRKVGKRFKQYSDYPLGTKAHATGGGCWIKVERGWNWATSGCVFPTPGADVIRIELPENKVAT